MIRRQALGWMAAGGGAAAFLPARVLAQASARVAEPEQFAPIADDRGDAAPAINAAIAALVRAGGGTLRFRSGKAYLLDSAAEASATLGDDYRASIAIPPGAANLTIDLNGATLRQVSDAYSFGAAYRMFNDRQVADGAIPLAGALRRGDGSARLKESARLAPGTLCMVIAGNALADGAYAPIAEMVVIAAASGDTVRFDRPLRKDYVPRGNWPFGVVDLTVLSTRNIALVGPGTVINARRRTGNLLQVLGLRMDRVRCEGRGGMALRGRDVLVSDCTAAIEADWSAPLFRPYCLAFDTGCSDIVVRNFRASGGDNVTYLHLHEGQANVAVSDLVIENGTRFDPHGENPFAISIPHGSWNVSIAGARVDNNPQGGALMVRRSSVAQTDNSGLSISDLVIQGHFRDTPVVIVSGTGDARIDGLDVRNASTSPGKPLVQLEGKAALSQIQGWAPG